MIDSMGISHLSSLMIEISVPSNLELVGYKIPIYTNKSSRTEVKNRTIQGVNNVNNNCYERKTRVLF